MSRAAHLLADQHISFVGDAYQTAAGVDALLVLSDWEEFAALDLKRIRKLMRHPLVVDGRNLYSPSRMAQLGFYYASVGRPDVVPEGGLGMPLMATGKDELEPQLGF